MRQMFLVLGLFFSLSVNADVIQMLNLQTDAAPGETGYLFAEVNSQDEFMSLIFEYPGGDPVQMTIKELSKGKKTVLKMGPIKVLEVSATINNPKSFVLNIHYLYEYKLTGSTRKVKQVRMQYNEAANFHETIDLDMDRSITNAFAYVNEVKGKQVGIREIETW